MQRMIGIPSVPHHLFCLTHIKLNGMLVYPNAKINIGLHVVEKRPDSYHNLKTVFYPIPLCDELQVETCTDTQGTNSCTLEVSGLNVAGASDDNLVTKAYRMLQADFELPAVQVRLHKVIPMGAGLGGGSSDGAFMLRVMNELAGLQLSDEQLEQYAARLGADCAFFIRNKPVMATGIGNVFHPISLSLKGYWLVLVKPEIFVSTKVAFAGLTPKYPEVDLPTLVNRTPDTWRSAVYNDFEKTVFAEFPAISQIKEQLYRSGAIYASMSGSGSTVYALFDKPVAELETMFDGCFYASYLLD